jgi:hypothetical protein
LIRPRMRCSSLRGSDRATQRTSAMVTAGIGFNDVRSRRARHPAAHAASRRLRYAPGMTVKIRYCTA